MDQSIGFSDRRSLIATLALLPLAACATPMGRYTVEDAVRRLLQLSSERAFARLTEANLAQRRQAAIFGTYGGMLLILAALIMRWLA